MQQQQRSILDEMKHQFKSGNLMKLIFINVIVFLVINIIGVVARLSGGNTQLLLDEFVFNTFTIQIPWKEFITHPWGLLISFFSHQGFIHLLFNMLILYSFGRIFTQFLSQKRLLYTYMLGGIFGGLFELGSQIFPTIATTSAIGASGAVMAVIIAIAVHKPRIELNLFGTFKVQLYLIAGIIFILDFISLGLNDGTGYFSHIGGAALGFLSVQQLSSPTNIVNMAQRFGDWSLRLFRKKPKLNITQADARRMSDEEYNQDKKRRQEQVDVILDKISKSGYESLSKKEKDFLFKQSK